MHTYYIAISKLNSTQLIVDKKTVKDIREIINMYKEACRNNKGNALTKLLLLVK